MKTKSKPTKGQPQHTLAAPVGPPILPYETDEDLSPSCRVDELVFAELAQRNIAPMHLCSDAVFLRRAYIDVIGTLPTSTEARNFLQDSSPTKRANLIETLFDREEYSQYWATKWCDLLRVKSEFPVNLWPLASQAYHRWIRTAIRDNMPYDQFVRSLLTASGSNFRDPAVNFYRSIPGRKPESIARFVALIFMGERAEHWPSGRLQSMAPFFSQIGFKGTAEWKEEIVLWDPVKKAAWASGEAGPSADFPDGEQAVFQSNRDPREVFADWRTAPSNPWMAQNIVNRIWSWLLGRGIIHEPDDIRPDNPPSNAPLLAYLERVLVASRFDTRSVYRVILNSKVYRLSSVTKTVDPAAESLFACYPIRRLDAEVLIDAIDQISGTTEVYSSEIPEPFTFLPPDQRAIDLPDGSITSTFLEMFGRPTRDTGLESERNNRLTSSQRLHLLNSSHIRRKIDQIPANLGLMQGAKPATQILDELYLAILSRFPTDDERKVVLDYMQRPDANKRDTVIDVAWAAINSAEFLFRH